MDWKKKKTTFFDIKCHDSYLMKCLHDKISQNDTICWHLYLKARVWSSKIPTGQQLSQYGKWDGLILSLLSYQFEFYWLLLDCKQKHMVAINIVC